jgi:lipopolysaccharide export system protein LptA
MKSGLLFLAIFGFAILAGGQTPPQEQRVPIKATNVVEAGNAIQFRGNVQIVIGNSVVVADEVDVPTARFNKDGSPNPIQLRGNVHLTFDGTAPVRIERL